MNKNGFSRCTELYIGRLRKEGRHSTAHIYTNALFSFTRSRGTTHVAFRQVTHERLRCYGQYLYSSGLEPNTVSTYMRMLRSIYSRGVESSRASYVHRLFHDVYTGVGIYQKEVLPAGELNRLLYEDSRSERLHRTQAIAALMFQFCGMPFADLAHSKKSSLERNITRYNRIGAKTPTSVEILDTAQDTTSRLRDCQPSHPDRPGYLFSTLLDDKKREDENVRREYQSALRRFNNRLKRLAKALRLTSLVTPYTICHSWATTARYRGVSVEMASESLGHKSIKTTQIYLKGFGLRERVEVNQMNLSYVKDCRIGRV